MDEPRTVRIVAGSLRFNATQAEPQYAAHFLAGGGLLGSAAGAGRTDFSVTGSDQAVFHQLDPVSAVAIEIPMPPKLLAQLEYDAETNTVIVDDRAKLNICCTRQGAGVNGTYCTTHAGAGAIYLADLLRSDQGHAQVPVVYGTLAAYSAVVGISGVVLTLDTSAGPLTPSLRFENMLGDAKRLAEAEVQVDAYARAGWERRYNQVQYPHARTLTKTVARVPAGVNDSGFQVVPDIVEQEFPYGIVVLNSLLKRAISIDISPTGHCHQVEGDYRMQGLGLKPGVDAFLEATCAPVGLAGLRAAAQAPIVATALSDIATYLMPYRADGRTVLRQQGSAFDSIESWLRTTQRRWDEANDCDGSALLVTSMLQLIKRECTRAAALPLRRLDNQTRETLPYTRDEWIAAHPFAWAVYNVIHPHYTYGVAVVGAAGAEASGATGDTDCKEKPKQLAGHAIALLVPTPQFLFALHNGGKQQIEGKPVSTDPLRTHGTRWRAVYSKGVRDTLPLGEQDWFSFEATDFAPAPAGVDSSDTRATIAGAEALRALAVEGTTPAVGSLFANAAAGGAAFAALVAGAQADSCAFAKAAPSVGRGRKVLHVAGDRDVHRFYHDIVELDLPSDHPLYVDGELHEAGEAAAQFLFSPWPDTEFDDNTDGTAMQVAGIPPSALSLGKYTSAPIVAVNRDEWELLDHASHRARDDVVPPRPALGRQLSEDEAARLKQSMARLDELTTRFAQNTGRGHPISYILSYATLVHNPEAIHHFCRQVANVATAAKADVVVVDDLATMPDGTQAGYFAVVHAMIEV